MKQVKKGFFIRRKDFEADTFILADVHYLTEIEIINLIREFDFMEDRSIDRIELWELGAEDKVSRNDIVMAALELEYFHSALAEEILQKLNPISRTLIFKDVKSPENRELIESVLVRDDVDFPSECFRTARSKEFRTFLASIALDDRLRSRYA